MQSNFDNKFIYSLQYFNLWNKSSEGGEKCQPFAMKTWSVRPSQCATVSHLITPTNRKSKQKCG